MSTDFDKKFEKYQSSSSVWDKVKHIVQPVLCVALGTVIGQTIEGRDNALQVPSFHQLAINSLYRRHKQVSQYFEDYLPHTLLSALCLLHA